MNPHCISVGYHVCVENGQELNEPLGIECLITPLARFGDRIVVGPLTKMTYRSFMDVILVSANFDSEQIVEIYDSNPHSLVLIGGAFPTTNPDLVLDRCPYAVVMVGEGEDTLNYIIRYILEEGRITRLNLEALSGIPNLVFRSGKNTVETPRSVGRLPLSDMVTTRVCLNKILNSDGMVRLESGRGCDWNRCSFCTVPKKYNYAACRRYPLERTKAEIIHLSEKGARNLAFTDEEFIGRDPGYTEDLVDWIIGSKDCGILPKGLKFMASISVNLTMGNAWNNGRNKELLRKMKTAGFDSCFVGIESGSRTQLIRYRKGVTPEMNAEFLSVMDSIGMVADIGFIMFDPLMEFKELVENVRFIRDNGLYRSSSRLVKKMILMPGTKYTTKFIETTGIPVPAQHSSDDGWMYSDIRVREVLHRISIERRDVDLELQSKLRKGEMSPEDRMKLLDSRESEFLKLERIVFEIEARATPSFQDSAKGEVQ